MLSSVLIAGFALASSASSRALPPRADTFGSCGSPAIVFALGLDGRTDPAFEPANKADFNHGSALGIGVITSFICQQLNDKCKASATQIANCNAGATAASKSTGQAAADAFNAALGVTATSPSPVPETAGAVDAGAASPTPSPEAVAASPAATTNTNTNIDLGKCTDPTVTFGPGLDGRKATEFSFIPTDTQQFAHGSALNPDIIYQFVCDTFVNVCGFKQADATFTTCKAAQQAANALGKTGASADKFNELLGFTTNFAALDSSVSATPAAPAANAAVLAAGTPAASVCVPETTTVIATVTAAAPAGATTTTEASTTPAANAAAVTTSEKPDLGTCTDISVKFGFGLDGRKATEASFLPNNLNEFAHGSALNPDIIFQFQCDNLVNRCGLTRTDAAVTQCQSARQTAVAVGRTGKTADTFNELMGFTTNFAALDTGSAATNTGKRSVGRKIKRDPRIALKELTNMARRRGFTPAKPVKVA